MGGGLPGAGQQKAEPLSRREAVWARLVEPFRSGSRIDLGLVLVFLVVNGLVLVNAGLHDPRIGYDADGNLDYIQALSEARLPTPEDTHEFFSPPLPFAVPAALLALTDMGVVWAAKLAQLVNLLLSIGLTWFLIRTCRLLGPRSSLAVGALAFLGVLPVYYKTFAFVRGEPYVAFFSMVVLYYSVLIFLRRQITAANVTLLGVSMGLCALSRQWGVLVFPAVFLLLAGQWIRLPRWRAPIARTLGLCLVLIAVVSGWFYGSLRSRYGSMTAFNREPAARFSLSNQPPEFYFGLSPAALFSNPIRPSFPNRLVPIFYSEIWGDYWGYFVVYGLDPRKPEFVNGLYLQHFFAQGGRPRWLETNYESIGAYLGRVNRVSTLPSALALIALVLAAVGVLRGPGGSPWIAYRRAIQAFLLVAIATTMAGYLWFLVMYPIPGKGDTIKATYVLQIFPWLAVLVGIFLADVERRSRLWYRLILAGLGLVFVHNLGVVLTRYSMHRLL